MSLQKLFVVAATLFCCFGAFAGNESGADSRLCSDPEIQDGHFVAQFFGISQPSPTVELFVPTGESSGEVFKGTCGHIPQTDEFAIACLVTTSETAYKVTLMSNGTEELFASITDVNRPKESVRLPCR